MQHCGGEKAAEDSQKRGVDRLKSFRFYVMQKSSMNGTLKHRKNAPYIDGKSPYTKLVVEEGVTNGND